MEENKLNLKPFDLQKAKAGKPVCTRDGRKARIICFDAKDDKERHIIALVDSRDCKKELAYTYDNSGKCCFNYFSTSNYDLMMLPEKKEGWINIYNADTTFNYVEGRIYETKEEAIKKFKEEVIENKREENEYIDTIKVTWEE